MSAEGPASEVESLWSRVAELPLVVEASYEDFDDLWAPFPTGVGPAGAYTASLEPEAQVALRTEFARRLGEPEGPFTLSARAWCAVATKAK